MNIIGLKRILFISLIIAVLLISYVQIVYAATTSELQKEQSNIDAQIKQKQTEIAGVKEELSENLNKINELNSQIATYEGEISDLETRLDNVKIEISQKETQIAEQEEKFRIQKDLLDKRLIAMYEAGATSYLDLLLSSDGLSDFISKYYLISEIAENDQELLANIEELRLQIEDEKEYLQSAKAEIETTQQAIEEKRNVTQSSKQQKQAIVSNLSAEEKALQEELDEFEEHKKEIQRELAALAKKNGNITPVAPSAAGYTSPLPGRTKANITMGYQGYVGHTGVDFACPGGTAILAVKSGTVVRSEGKRNGAGNYISYGEYIIIDHHDGTMTLYAHMQSGSRRVSPGQSVAQGDQIGSVGTTGNSSGNHLHFEVRINGKAVNPVPYLP